MGVLGAVLRFTLTRIIPVLVLLVALVLGWLTTSTPIPEGKLFATFFPFMKGLWPATIVGHGKMPGTPPVPDDMKPEPRPENEMFVELPGGHRVPQNGLGMCCRPTAYDDVLAERTVLWYLLLGGRHIDGAHIYLNHKAIGRGIQEAIRRGVPRDEIFVTTKLWPSYFGYNSTKEIVPTWLDELGLEYIDLVLMHMPIHPAHAFLGTSKECNKLKLSKTECRQQTWKALSELREQGIMRNVGVSNFVAHQLADLTEMENVAPVSMNQMIFNPFLSSDWVEAAEYCRQHGIAITGYNSLGGMLQHHETKTVETLTGLAAKYNRSVAQIMLRWAMAKQVVVIPGTGNPDYMRENLSIYDFELSEEDVRAIDQLQKSRETSKKFFAMPKLE
ncbi:hypothetical protein ACA910_005887 [Epithemia clementina (nom. ined.)]